jgi:ribosomal protein S18 acetylase RimI-like enzyme
MIRALQRQDYDQWLPLWQKNCLHQVSDEVTSETWRRLTNPKERVHGLGIFDGNETLLGFLHYVLHDTTGFIEPACYMQDLYISETHRRQGLAKRLVWELHTLGKDQNWARIYWFAQNSDEAVQNLYKNLGIPMDFTLFMLPTDN